MKDDIMDRIPRMPDTEIIEGLYKDLQIQEEYFRKIVIEAYQNLSNSRKRRIEVENIIKIFVENERLNNGG